LVEDCTHVCACELFVYLSFDLMTVLLFQENIVCNAEVDAETRVDVVQLLDTDRQSLVIKQSHLLYCVYYVALQSSWLVSVCYWKKWKNR